MNSLTPGKAIRQNCIDCMGQASEVKGCGGDTLREGPCLFYPYRMGRGRPKLKLIRSFCLYCMQNQVKLIKECPTENCPFHPYRMGRNPKKAGQGGRKWNFKASKAGKGIQARGSTNNDQNNQ